MDALRKEMIYTIEDSYELPDGERADWIVEIVSPRSRRMDYYKKLFQYRTAGVREYWVVDPDKNMVTVYSFEQEDMEEYSFGEEVPVGIYEGFSIRVQ